MVTFAMKLEDARKTGREEGREQGREEGRKTGAWEKAISTARNLLRMGFPAQQISEATKLSVEEIAALKSDLR